MYETDLHTAHCGLNNTELHFTKLEVAVGYTFNIKLCNKAGCVNRTVEHEANRRGYRKAMQPGCPCNMSNKYVETGSGAVAPSNGEGLQGRCGRVGPR